MSPLPFAHDLRLPPLRPSHDATGPLISSLLAPRKQLGDRHADRAPAAVGALIRQLLQLDVQRGGQQDRGRDPGLAGQPLTAQQPADR